MQPVATSSSPSLRVVSTTPTQTPSAPNGPVAAPNAPLSSVSGTTVSGLVVPVGDAPGGPSWSQTLLHIAQQAGPQPVPAATLASARGYRGTPWPRLQVLLRLTHVSRVLANDAGNQLDDEMWAKLDTVRSGFAALAGEDLSEQSIRNEGGFRVVQQAARAVALAESSSLQQTFAQTLHSLPRLPFPKDVHAFIQAVLRESYAQQSSLLSDMASKMQTFNELRRRMRKRLRDARSALASAEDGDFFPEGFDFSMFDGTDFGGEGHQAEVLADDDDPDQREMDPRRVAAALHNFPVHTENLQPSVPNVVEDPRPVPGYVFNAQRVEAYVDALEQKIAQVGDDAQLANLDLQNALQRQQRVLQLMSNTSSVLHETAMSIIRKIGG